MNSQLLGTGDTYYVMAQLALRGFHASCTFGNAPYVDVLVSTPDGHTTLSIQVKPKIEKVLVGTGLGCGIVAAKNNEPVTGSCRRFIIPTELRPYLRGHSPSKH
jgi:hypothetical protein